MPRPALLTCLAALVVAPVAAAWADTDAVPASLWVSPGGSDDDDCRRDSPCTSLTRALGLALPGDTITVVAAGDSLWLRRALLVASRDARYRGALAADPGHRGGTGYVRLATTWATELRPRFDAAARALPNLARALNRWTGIVASVGTPVVIGTPDFDRAPFVYLTTERAFELTPTEARALGSYLRGGGFVLADNASAHLFEHGQAEAAIRAAFEQALGRQGRLRRIPESHPIYRSVYELSGPPPGLDEARPRHFLEGVFLDGRLAAVFADKGYVHAWALSHGNEAQLRFGINAVVYALRDPGDDRRLHLRVQP